jgi:hypothetical protein
MTDATLPAQLDAAADGAFSGKLADPADTLTKRGGKGIVVYEGQEYDRLAWTRRCAALGYTLAAGEGAILNAALVEVEKERDALRAKLTRYKGKTRRLYAMLKGELQGLRRDRARVDWLSDSAQLEAIGIDDVGEAGGCVGLDMYEHASIVADERGNEGDLTDTDLRRGFRRMIDAAMAVQPTPTGDTP